MACDVMICLVCVHCDYWLNTIIEIVIYMKIKVNMSGSEVGIDTQFSKD
ncbi:uncharacterized protein G2W53_013952 [Senna tora]|uniref:Uncharacterized protein n=1 Tax=Senna tora TaxID=362788 RepID=A0A834WSV3_9FABA|nr:uncharacterized protein G2W53_013952 [Senna tora]